MKKPTLEARVAKLERAVLADAHDAEVAAHALLEFRDKLLEIIDKLRSRDCFICRRTDAIEDRMVNFVRYRYCTRCGWWQKRR